MMTQHGKRHPNSFYSGAILGFLAALGAAEESSILAGATNSQVDLWTDWFQAANA